MLGLEVDTSHAGVANLLRVHAAINKRPRASRDMASALNCYTDSYVRIEKMMIELAKKHREADMKMQRKIARSREDMTERVIKMMNDAIRSMSSQPERVAAILAKVIPTGLSLSAAAGTHRTFSSDLCRDRAIAATSNVNTISCIPFHALHWNLCICGSTV